MVTDPQKNRRTSRYLAWAVEIVGFVLLVAGVALVFVPAALIVAGSALVVAVERA